MERSVPVLLVVDSGERQVSAWAAILQPSFRVTSAWSADDEENVASIDAVLLGAGVPVDERIGRCRALRERGYVGGVLALCDDPAQGERLLEAGVDDFLVAPFASAELIARMRGCIRRAAARSRLRWGQVEVDRIGRVADVRGREVALTARECELFVQLMKAGGQSVSRAKLRKLLLRHKEDRGSNLVEVYLSRLREKLGSDAAMIETVRGVGYRLRR